MTASKQMSEYAKIVVNFERRADGGLRAFSDDVPGFVLSHADCDSVLSDVRPALEMILSHLIGGRVTVAPLPLLREKLAEAGVISPDLPIFPTREYVTHIHH